MAHQLQHTSASACDNQLIRKATLPPMPPPDSKQQPAEQPALPQVHDPCPHLSNYNTLAEHNVATATNFNSGFHKKLIGCNGCMQWFHNSVGHLLTAQPRYRGASCWETCKHLHGQQPQEAVSTPQAWPSQASHECDCHRWQLPCDTSNSPWLVT